MSSKLTVSQCPKCGNASPHIGVDKCPTCDTPSRTRSLPAVVDLIKLSVSDKCRELPLLSFAMTALERTVLTPVFPDLKSVSLFGNYGKGHESGVDARDLSRFADGQFGGAFSILLFDYFEEHTKALAEIARVIAPGGVLFTHIGPYRLRDGNEPPSIKQMIKPRPGYFDYVNQEMPSIWVSREWFTNAMRQAGFDASFIEVKDELSGESVPWFVGYKLPPQKTANSRLDKLLSGVRLAPRLSAPIHTREHTTRVDPAFGFKRVNITLTVPTVPTPGNGAEFTEHVFDADNGVSTDQVVAVARDGILFSNDLGGSWDFAEVKPQTPGTRFGNSFTLSNGNHLVQAFAGETTPSSPIYRMNRNWQITDVSDPAHARWHGARSIDERACTIMFGEYPLNSVKYRADFDKRRAELEPECMNSRIFRSRDGGASWQVVFEKSWEDIRHFHTVAADPFDRGVWWASSGDRAKESMVWRSEDDGDTWVEAIDKAPDVALPPHFQHNKQAVYRFTDLVIAPDRLIWGADDWLGNLDKLHIDTIPLAARIGSRLFSAPRASTLSAKTIGFVGNPIRSIIDVGQAYIVATEAKHFEFPRPQVFLLSKTEPFLCAELFTVDTFGPNGTGFTYSRASRVAKGGRFFSYRATNDVFQSGPRLLQWDIAFE